MDAGDTGIKQVKETMRVSGLAGATWSGHMTSRPVNCESTRNLPRFTQRQSSVAKIQASPPVRALESSRLHEIR